MQYQTCLFICLFFNVGPQFGLKMVQILNGYCVVYIKQPLSAAHSKPWSKYAFSLFLHTNCEKGKQQKYLGKIIVKILNLISFFLMPIKYSVTYCNKNECIAGNG